MKKPRAARRRRGDRRVKLTVRVPFRTKAEYTRCCRMLGLTVSEKARQDMEAAINKQRSGEYLPLGVVTWGVGKNSIRVHVARSGKESIVMIFEGTVLFELLEFLERLGSSRSRARLLKQLLQTQFGASTGPVSLEDEKLVVRRPGR